MDLSRAILAVLSALMFAAAVFVLVTGEAERPHCVDSYMNASTGCR